MSGIDAEPLGGELFAGDQANPTQRSLRKRHGSGFGGDATLKPAQARYPDGQQPASREGTATTSAAILG